MRFRTSALAAAVLGAAIVVLLGPLRPSLTEEKRPILSSKTYSVGDIVARYEKTGKITYDFESLRELIPQVIAPDSWEESGAKVDVVLTPAGEPRGIVVSQRPEVHEEIAALLAALRQAARDSAAGTPAQCYGKGLEPDPRNEKIAKALAGKVTLDFDKRPLREVAAQLARQSGVAIQLDKKGMEEVGIGEDAPVTLHVKEISLRSALRLMLRQLDVTYVLQGGSLLITSPEQAEAEARMIPAVYPIGDLVRGRDKSKRVRYDAEVAQQLADVITATIKPTTWSEVGGPGGIAVAMFDNVQALVVCQSYDVHEEVAALLSALRTAVKRAADNSSDVTPIPLLVLPEEQAACEAIEKALAMKVSLHFTNTPLAEVAAKLGKLAGINVLLDLHGLGEAGLSGETAVTFRAKNVSLRAALNGMLREHGLTCMICDEVLLITTVDEAESRLPIAIYPVGDLVVCRDEKGQLWDDYDTLVDIITSTIRSSTWDMFGGPGGMTGISLGKAKVLIVSQTDEVHREVLDLLTKIRGIARKSPAPARPPLREKPATPAPPPVIDPVSSQPGGFF